jgi:hypothetical protein
MDWRLVPSVVRAVGVATAALVTLLAGGILAPASAQTAPPPGAPVVTSQRVTVNNQPRTRVTFVWTYDMNTFPDSVFAFQATLQGLTVGPITLTNTTRTGNTLTATFDTAPVDGQITANVQIIAFNFLGLSPPSSPTVAILGAANPNQSPGIPVLNQPTVQGNTVTLSWTAPLVGGAPEGYEIVASVQATGQGLVLPLGNQTSVVVPNVPTGNFIVQIRAKNAFGTGELSEPRLVVVGVLLGTGDLQATLSWDSAADMDLHILEPNGAHVFYGSRTGVTARLDRDDTDGLGPENIFVDSGRGASGVYRIYLVHYGRAVPTVSTIAIRINAGRPNERSAFFTRRTSAANPSGGFNVAEVDLVNGTINELTGTRAADSRFNTFGASAKAPGSQE